MVWHPHLWHPTTQVALHPEPLRVRAARGCLLSLEDGRELIDAISSWWVTLHGHGEPNIAAAIAHQAEQLEQVIFANFSHAPAEQLATRLAAHTGLERMFFSDNGSTAVEVALKIAWQWWRNQGSERRQLIAFEGAYHGDTFGAMALGDRSVFTDPYDSLLMALGDRSVFTDPYDSLLFDVRRLPWPHTHWGDSSVEAREQDALAALDQALETPTAALILEPLIQGASGMRLVRPAFLRAVQARVREKGALLIADEVMTGFGRTGALFASQLAGIQPDLMALSKGLTGGFLPMGATMASERLYQGFISREPSHTFFHGHSFTANPLGCAAALASLDQLEANPEAYSGFESRHRRHLEHLQQLDGIARVRCLGTMAAFELTIGATEYLNPIGRQLQHQALQRGVYLRPLGNVVYLLPPLCISDSQLERCYAAIASGLADVNRT